MATPEDPRSPNTSEPPPEPALPDPGAPPAPAQSAEPAPHGGGDGLDEAAGAPAAAAPGPAPRPDTAAGPAHAALDLDATAAALRARFPQLFGGPPRPLKLRIQADIQQRAPGVFSRQALSAYLQRHTTRTPYLAAMAQSASRFDLDGQASEPLSDEHREAAAAEVLRRRERRQAHAPQARGPRTPEPGGDVDAPRGPVARPERAQRPARPVQAGAPRAQAAAGPQARRHGAANAQDGAGPRALSPEDELRRERMALARDYQSTTLTKANFCALKRITPELLDAALAWVAEDRARWAREQTARERAQREAAAPAPSSPSSPSSPTLATGAGDAAPQAVPAAPAAPQAADDGLAVSLQVNAPAAAVFDAWSDPAHFSRWFDPAAQALAVQGELAQEGGRWQFALHDPEGRAQARCIAWIKLQRPHRLLYDYGDDTAGPWFRVGVTLRPQGGQTLVRLRLRWPDAAARQAALAQADMVASSTRLLERMALVARTIAAGTGAAAPAAGKGKAQGRGQAADAPRLPADRGRASAADARHDPAARPPASPAEDAGDLLVMAPALRAWVARVVQAAGSAPAEAQAVADSLVGANLTGHDSHGVGMMPRYVDNLLAGGLRANQSLRVVLDQGALLTLDGQAGYGQVMARDAMQLAIERARQHGVAVVGLAHAHHIGRIGQWAEQCVAAGLVSVHFVNVISQAIVAPFNGSDGRFVTNPMCVGIPVAGGEPVVLDFATSRIAMGKVRVAHHRGRRIAPGTLIDAQGRPTRDPAVMFADPPGALLPFGEHKGYGLALVCEILGGALSGGITLHQPPSPHSIINNMLSFVVDPERLGTAATLAREARAFADWVQASPPLPGRRVLLPGQPERERLAQRSREGIAIDPTTWAQMMEAAERVGVTREESLRLTGQAELPQAPPAATLEPAPQGSPDPAADPFAQAAPQATEQAAPGPTPD
jgi:uncharacterized oxidoreductase